MYVHTCNACASIHRYCSYKRLHIGVKYISEEYTSFKDEKFHQKIWPRDDNMTVEIVLYIALYLATYVTMKMNRKELKLKKNTLYYILNTTVSYIYSVRVTHYF